MSTLVLLRDWREQKPYQFQFVKPSPLIEVVTLETGDYSVKGHENRVTVERKSVTDLFSSVGKDRDRFQKEMERLSNFDYAAVVVEGDWRKCLRDPPLFSQLRPKSLFATVIAWEQRYGVSFWMCPNRNFAERATYRILERFYHDRRNQKSNSR